MKMFRLGLVVLLAIFFYQPAMANVELNVNVEDDSFNNKIYYMDEGKEEDVSLSWDEKVVYSGEGKVAITVKNKVAGDLIVKVDLLSSSGAGGEMSVTSLWFKTGYVAGPFGTPVEIIELLGDGEGTSVIDEENDTPETVTKADLTTLCLKEDLAANTTTTLLEFFTKFKLASHLIFTAILVDDVDADSPQVIGVDVQTVFFNYTGAGEDDEVSPGNDEDPIWLDLIQAD